MTTIAWDGTTLAADKQATNAGLRRTVTKIFRAGDLMFAACGDLAESLEVIEWIKAGADPEKLPASQRSERWNSIFTVTKQGVIKVYECGPYPIQFEDEIFACGSGRDFALGAMRMGADAVRAVEVASGFDSGTGCGVDRLSFKDSE